MSATRQRNRPGRIRSGLGGLLLLTGLLAGCSPEVVVDVQERVLEIQAPPKTLIVDVKGRITHRQSEAIKAPVRDLRLAWMASEGSDLEAGDVVLRYDTELLELRLQAKREELATLDRRERGIRLSNKRSLYNLRLRLLESEANKAALELEYERSKKIDEEERGILVRELELARTNLETAEDKLSTLKAVARSGGAAAAEVREAELAYERALANVKIPEVQLTVFDADDGTDDRIKLDRKLGKLDLALASESQHGSLKAQIILGETVQVRDASWVELSRTSLKQDAEKSELVMSNALERSELGGVFTPRKQRDRIPMVPGRELGSREVGKVLSTKDAVIKIQIPERMRESLRLNAGSSITAEVNVPSHGPSLLPGHLESIGMVKQSVSGIGPSYAGLVTLDAWPKGLHVGAGALCKLSIPVPEDAVIIPRWWASRAFRPLVKMADEEVRRLDVQAVGDQLIVFNGLTPGDRILPPPPDKAEQVVLTGKVEVPDQIKVTIGRSRSWEWTVLDIIDDGSTVTNGQIVARLRNRYRDELDTGNIRLEEEKAETALELDRMMAHGRLGTAFMNWQEARLDAEAARVNYEIDRQKENETAIMQSAVSAHLATLARHETEADTARFAAPVYREIRSQDQRATDLLNSAIGRLEEAQAQLSQANARHARDWPSTWIARQSARQMNTSESKAEQAYRQAQATHQQELSAADAKYERSLKSIERDMETLARQEIRSPAAGRIYHNPSAYKPMEIGERLPSGHLFSIPNGTRRQFRIDVPARLYQDVTLGQELEFSLPAEGTKRHQGRIIHIADFFEKLGDARSRRGYGRSSQPIQHQALETTVRVTVEFEVATVDEVPPGSTAVVELEQ